MKKNKWSLIFLIPLFRSKIYKHPPSKIEMLEVFLHCLPCNLIACLLPCSWSLIHGGGALSVNILSVLRLMDASHLGGILIFNTEVLSLTRY